VLAAMILSMCTAPLVIQFAEPIVRKLTANDWLARAAQVTQIAARSMARQDHIIVCGYGRSGQNLARLLERRTSRTSRSTPTRSACARRPATAAA
jgi:CPA2 family monovalent cation:H+ antiporter-2